MNQPPEYCPYCGSPVEPVDSPMTADVVDTPMIYRCDAGDDYVFYNPTPGGSAAVVDGDRLLLVEDFRSPGEWKLPSGRMELGETPREGVARELEEETGLAVDPDDLCYFDDGAGEPAPDQHMIGINYAVAREDTRGELRAASDATDARFFTIDEFEESDEVIKHTHVDRFGEESLPRILAAAKAAVERGPVTRP